jgi:hypothetical protein
LVPHVLCVRAHLENMSWGGRVYRGDPPACARTGESVTNRRDKTPNAGNLGGRGAQTDRRDCSRHRMSLRMSSERKETSGLPRLSACRAYPCAFYLGALAQCHHVAHGRPPLDNGKHVGAPSIQGRALFAGEVVTLVDADDSGPASRDVIENLLRHLEAHAKPLEACCHRPAQIVQAPVCHTGLSVESRLGRRETVEGSAKAGEDQLAGSRHSSQQVLRRRRQRNDIKG